MELNAKKCNILEIGKNEMRQTWIYMLRQNITSIKRGERFGSGYTEQLITRETYIQNIC